MSYSTICASCGTRFDAAHPAARTCGDTCRQAASRRRRREERRAVAAQLRAGLDGGDPVALAAGLGGALALLDAV